MTNRDPGRLVRVDKSGVEEDREHRVACDDARCPGCSGDRWDYRIPDSASVAYVQLANTMAQLRIRLHSQIRAGRVHWSVDEYPALLEAARQAVIDALVQDRGGGAGSETDHERTVGEYIGRGYLTTILREMRSNRREK